MHLFIMFCFCEAFLFLYCYLFFYVIFPLVNQVLVDIQLLIANGFDEREELCDRRKYGYYWNWKDSLSEKLDIF